MRDRLEMALEPVTRTAGSETSRQARNNHKGSVRPYPEKAEKTSTFLARTFSAGVRVKRDKSRSETDFGIFGSL